MQKRRTALHYAAEGDYVEIAKLLFSAESDLDVDATDEVRARIRVDDFSANSYTWKMVLAISGG